MNKLNHLNVNEIVQGIARYVLPILGPWGADSGSPGHFWGNT